ncbi:MAG: hypothetical protein QW815_06205 [Nitrososphaerota archaeon]
MRADSNTWYYSFSPNVASFISTHESVKPIVRGVLYPLIGILHLGVISATSLNNGELGIIITGVIISALIGLTYFTPLTLIPLYVVKKWRKNMPKPSRVMTLLLPWAGSVIMILLGEATLAPLLIMSGTSMLVTSTIALTAGALALKVVQKIP